MIWWPRRIIHPVVRRKRIFISYRRSDTQAVAERLYRRLSQHFGATNVFLDRADIEHGQRWFDEVRRELEQADVVLALIGPMWLQALEERVGGEDVLRFELAEALACEKQVIPVLVDGACIPDLSRLPELRGLADIQAISLAGSRFLDRALRELLGRLKAGPGLAVAWSIVNLVAWPVAFFLHLTFSLTEFTAANQQVDDPTPVNHVVSPASIAFFAGLGALVGLSLGVPQWLVLRAWFDVRALLPAYTLVAAAAVGLGSAGRDRGLGAILAMPLLLALVLWLILRKQLQYAGWWSGANAVAPYATLIIAASIQVRDVDMRAALFALIGAPTLACGALLVWLMRRSQIARH